MLIVPTGEFLGIINDVLPLAAQDKDDPNAGILLEWDGEALHAHATDSLSAGISTYHPDDITDFDDDAAHAVVQWGATEEDDPSWRVFVALPDAKEIVKTFKLAYKFRAVPLNVKVNATGSRLIIERTRDTGKTEHVMTVQPVGGRADRFPDLFHLTTALEYEKATTDGVSVWGHRLAAFEHASRRGPVHLTPTGAFGDDTLHIRIGERFVGFVATQKPQRTERPEGA